MKRIMTVCAILLLTASVAYATMFHSNYKAFGMEEAVKMALEEGNRPATIIPDAIEVTDGNTLLLIFALYCYGADGDDIAEAATENNISELALLAGFKKAVAECTDTFADSQAYTPTSISFNGVPKPATSSRAISQSEF